MTTILLVDDDPLQASLMLSLLGRRFGDVRRAGDAAEALCLIEEPEFASKLGLVITGNQMQGIGGPAFVNELRARMPHVPVLVLGAPGEAPREYTEAQVTFLAKPFAAERMLELTGQMLGARKSAVA
jgi:two-component system response regulator GlrR